MYEMIIGGTHLGSVDGNEVGEVGTGMKLGICDEGVEVKEGRAKTRSGVESYSVTITR